MLFRSRTDLASVLVQKTEFPADEIAFHFRHLVARVIEDMETAADRNQFAAKESERPAARLDVNPGADEGE